jgi:hypothetical protein
MGPGLTSSRPRRGGAARETRGAEDVSHIRTEAALTAS